MDIKARIDGLSEAEAKTAIEECIQTMVKIIHCGDCQYSELLPDGTIDKCLTPWNCADILLDGVLEKVQHGHTSVDS